MGRRLFALLVVFGFLWVVSPLLMPVVMGGIFAIVLYPAVPWLMARRLTIGMSSAVLTLGVTVVVFLPTSLMVYLAAKAAFLQFQTLKEKPSSHGDLSEAVLGHPWVQSVLSWAGDWIPAGREEIAGAIQDLARSVSIKSADVLGGSLSCLPSLMLALVIIIVSIYFFLIDGNRLIHYVRRHSFFQATETERLLKTLESGCRSVVLASIVSGASQALVATLAYVIAGIPNAGLLGASVFLASFVPVVGTAPVTFGVVIHQFVMGHTGSAIAMAIVAVIVTTMDNLIRPAFLKGSVNLHPLLAFVAAFGGLQTIGFAGIFIGPILAALFVATVQVLFREPEMSPGPLV